VEAILSTQKLRDVDPSPTRGTYSTLGNVDFPFGSNIAGGYTITVTNNDSILGTSYSLDTALDTGDIFGQPGFLNLTLANSSQDVFSSDALPLTPPNVNSFANRNFTFTAYYGSLGGLSLNGTLDSLTVAAVPETSSILSTLALGAIGAAAYVYKKHKLAKVSTQRTEKHNYESC